MKKEREKKKFRRIAFETTNEVKDRLEKNAKKHRQSQTKYIEDLILLDNRESKFL